MKNLTIQSVEHALRLMDKNGYISFDGDVFITDSLNNSHWSQGSDTTGITLRARNLFSSGKPHCIALKSIEVSGHVQGFESICAQHIHAKESIGAGNIHAKTIRADKVECDTLTLHGKVGSKVKKTYINYMWDVYEEAKHELGEIFHSGQSYVWELPKEVATSLADVVNAGIEHMPATPVHPRRSFF